MKRQPSFDVTEAKRAHERLEESEARFRRIADLAGMGIFILGEDRKISYVNRTCADIFGYAPEEVIGRLSHRELIHPDDADRATERIARRLAGEVDDTNVVFKGLKKDGSLVYVELRGQLVDLDGKPSVLGTLIDVTERQRVVDELERSERRYRTVVDNIQEGVIVASATKKLYYNEPMARMLGFTPEEYRHVSFKSLVHPDDLARMTQQHAATSEAGLPMSDFVCRVIDKDGRTKWVSCKSSPIDWLGEKAAITFVQDITAQMQAEAALRESADIVSTMFMSVQDAFYLATMDDGRLIGMNEAFARMFGFARHEALGRTSGELGLWADYEDRTRMIRELESKGFVRNFQVIGHRKTGETFPVSISTTVCDIGGAKCIVGFMRDETERLQAERALRESEARYRLLADNITDVIWMLDPRTLRFTYVSPSCRLLTGYTSDELLNLPLGDIFPVHMREPLMQLVQSGVEQFQAQPDPFVDDQSEVELLRKDGSSIWTEISTRILRDPASGQVGVMGVARDQSARKNAEQALQQKQEQLRQSQKMEAIGQLAGGIAHDFNNLLTAILGYTDLVLASPEGHAEPLRLDLLEIKAAAKRAADLTQQILAFSRKQALRPEVICVNDVLSELKPLLDRILGEDIILEIQTSDDIGQCELDPGQFTQVLMNLVVNARDAMPAGGFLILETANVEVTGQHTLASLGQINAGSYVTLRCSDTGVGMDPATRSRIFEPFFTTKPPGEGTGLGLSTVYGIVQQSGGAVVVESEVGKGTVFTIYLPRNANTAEQFSKEDERPAARRGQGRVLIVEDEGAVGALAERVLASHGYTVLVASNATEALSIISAPGQTLDLLLTDIVLPAGMQGRELADAAKAAREDLRILYMSGYSRNSIVHGGRLDEGVNFLPKPFTPQELIAKVEEALAKRKEPARARGMGRGRRRLKS